ncbi:MAG: hypothetical protein VYC13_02465 [Actinomycetota bacterium]|nr:hypothetical protein [Actinomycetota bacterium]MED5166183.1 hypothetical protein [Actinomycetota bacterium]MED5438126.1 hypothetical protein [Actinomycetota bacterium]MEE3205972.1 hypothetical protein [Actinomycetota bacterium]
MTPIRTGFLAVLVLATGACGGAVDTTAPVPIPAPTTAVEVTASELGSAAGVRGAAVPDELGFEAVLIGGDILHGADLAGQDVLFWFWTPT